MKKRRYKGDVVTPKAKEGCEGGYVVVEDTVVVHQEVNLCIKKFQIDLEEDDKPWFSLTSTFSMYQQACLLDSTLTLTLGSLLIEDKMKKFNNKQL